MRGAWYNKISARGGPFARRRYPVPFLKYPGTRDQYPPKRKKGTRPYSLGTRGDDRVILYRVPL